jgi:hypothetical protein
MLSVMDALAAIPEPEGMRLRRCWPEWKNEGLTVGVAAVGGSAGIEGRGETWHHTDLQLSLDVAHDLSWRGPEVYVWPEAGDVRGVTRWLVYAIGFIEAEARKAFEAVCAAIDAKGL